MILYYFCKWKAAWKCCNHIMHKEFTSNQTAFTLTDNFFHLKLEDDCKNHKKHKGGKIF